MNGCGCKSCGGPAARAAWLQAREDRALARRVVQYAPFLLARRHETAADLANRIIHPSLYSAVVMRTAGRIAP